MTIFEKIIARQIPAKIIWEDEEAIAFHDVNPQAPVHVLIVPKRVVSRLTDAKDDDRALLGKLLLVARDLAKKLELSNGYRVVINCGPDAGESVPHLHVHLLGKRALACHRDEIAQALSIALRGFAGSRRRSLQTTREPVPNRSQ